MRPVREWQNVLILGWKRWFAQLRARCWKSLKSSAPSAKMTKHADLGLKMLFCTNSFTLLKTIKALCWKELKSGALSAKMLKRGDLRLKKLFCTNSCTLLKSAKKWWAQRKNNKSVLISGWKHCFAQTEVLCWKSLKSGEPSAKMKQLGWKRCFVQTGVLCWKVLKSGPPSAKMLKRADLGQKTVFCTNSCTLLKRVKKWCTQCRNDSTRWSRAENAVLYKLRYFVDNHWNVVCLVRKWKNVLNSGWKRGFAQTHALCRRLPKSGAPSAKMTKRADLVLKTLFYTRSCKR